MDIYQCMTCGQQWPHGGSQASFIATAQHADETRGGPEGMHLVFVGERVQLETLYQRKQHGGTLVLPNDNERLAPASPSMPEPPPSTLSALARRLGVSDGQARDLVQALFVAPERPLPASALDDVLPVGGQLLRWGDNGQPKAEAT